MDVKLWCLTLLSFERAAARLECSTALFGSSLIALVYSAAACCAGSEKSEEKHPTIGHGAKVGRSSVTLSHSPFLNRALPWSSSDEAVSAMPHSCTRERGENDKICLRVDQSVRSTSDD